MKLDSFEKLIRKVVREEIDYALRREFALIKEEIRSKDIIKEEIKPEPKIETSVPKKKKFTPQNYTKNNTLNSLLKSEILLILVLSILYFSKIISLK